MLFQSFHSQEERRAFAGSDFIELQYCKLKQGTKIKEIVSVNQIENWKNDSLYVSGDHMDPFFSSYSSIFNKGIYNNGACGIVDLFGINYYAPEQTDLMIEQLRERNSADDQVLLSWLKYARNYNGFYVLGV